MFNNQKMKTTIFIFLLGLLSLSALNGQETDGKYQEVDKMGDWGFIVTPYSLLASQSTDVGGEQIRQSFGDVSSLTNAGF